MTFWLSKGCKNDYREVAEGHCSRSPRRIVSRGSSPASAAKPARPRTSPWPPCYHYSNLWQTRRHRRRQGKAKMNPPQICGFTPAEWVLFHGILELYNWVYYISVLKYISFFLFFSTWQIPLEIFPFFAYNTAFGINTGTGNRTLRLIWHTECQHETARRRHKARALLASTVYVFY